MSRLIASILLSVLLFPVAAVVYLITFFVLVESRGLVGRREVLGYVIAGVLTWAFVAWYWVFVWRKTVKWNPRRIARTLYAALAAAGGGLMAGIVTGSLAEDFGFFIGTVVPPLLWLAATVLAWRETDAERATRLGAVGRDGGGGIPCPTCGYDMTGLRSTRCPECGTEFTLDELIASQPGRAAVELER